MEHRRQASLMAEYRAFNQLTPASPVATKVENMQSDLSPTQTAAAHAAIATLAQPLTADERKLCKLMGLDEAGFKEERDRKVKASLPGWHDGMEHGLTAEEANVAKLLGLPLADYAAQKVVEAKQRQERIGA
jgi:phage I-like protein